MSNHRRISSWSVTSVHSYFTPVVFSKNSLQLYNKSSDSQFAIHCYPYRITESLCLIYAWRRRCHRLQSPSQPLPFATVEIIAIKRRFVDSWLDHTAHFMQSHFFQYFKCRFFNMKFSIRLFLQTF